MATNEFGDNIVQGETNEFGDKIIAAEKPSNVLYNIDPEVLAKQTTSYIFGKELGLDSSTIAKTYSTIVKNVYGSSLKASEVQKRMQEDGFLANPQAEEWEVAEVAKAMLTDFKVSPQIAEERERRRLNKQVANIFYKIDRDESDLFTGPTKWAADIAAKSDRPNEIVSMPLYEEDDLLNMDTYKSLLEQAPTKQAVDELRKERKAVVARYWGETLAGQRNEFITKEMAKVTAGSKLEDVTLEAAKGLYSALLTVERGVLGTGIAAGMVWNQPSLDEVEKALQSSDMNRIEAAGKIGYVARAMSEAIPSFAYNMTVGKAGIFTVEYGNAYQDAKNNGGSDLVANAVALPIATINTIIESMQIDQIFTLAGAGKGAKQAVKQMVKDRAYKAFIKAGAKFTGLSVKTAINEAIEGGLQQGVSIVVPGIITGVYPKTEDGHIDWVEVGSQMGQSFIGEGLGGLFLGMGGSLYNARNYQNHKLAIAGQMITHEGLSEGEALTTATKVMERLVANDGDPKEIYQEELGKVKMADNRHKAAAHIIQKAKGIPDEQYRRIATETTGKLSLTEMNYEEAERFIGVLRHAEAEEVEKVEGEEPEPEGDIEAEVAAIRDEEAPGFAQGVETPLTPTQTTPQGEIVRPEYPEGIHLAPVNMEKGKPGYAIEDTGRSYSDRTGFESVKDWPKAVVYRDGEGRVQGTLSFGVNKDGTLDIDFPVEAFVSPEFRRQGIATRMFAVAKETGYDLDTAKDRLLLSEEGEALQRARGVIRTTPPGEIAAEKPTEARQRITGGAAPTISPPPPPKAVAPSTPVQKPTAALPVAKTLSPAAKNKEINKALSLDQARLQNLITPQGDIWRVSVKDFAGEMQQVGDFKTLKEARAAILPAREKVLADLRAGRAALPAGAVEKQPEALAKQAQGEKAERAGAQISRKVKQDTVARIQKHEIYQTELEAQDIRAEQVGGGVYYFPKKYKGEIQEAIERHPLLRFHITHDPSKGGNWEKAVQEGLEKRTGGTAGEMDVSEFLDRLAESVENRKKVGKINKKALTAMANSGDMESEILAAKYDMIQEGFTADEINATIIEIADDYGVKTDQIGPELIGEQNVKAKPEVVRGVEEKARTVEETEERLAIQQENAATDVGDFLDGIVEKARPTETNLFGQTRPVLQGGALGKQEEFFDKERFKMPPPDIKGQMTIPAKSDTGKLPGGRQAGGLLNTPFGDDDLLQAKIDEILGMTPKKARAEVVVPDRKKTLKELKRTRKLEALKMGGKGAVTGIDRAFGLMSTRVKNISPTVFQDIRNKVINPSLMLRAERTAEAHPFIDGINTKLSEEDRDDFEIAQWQANEDEINRIVGKYGLVKEYDQYRQMLDLIFHEGNAVGMDIDYRTAYFPSAIKDFDGLMKELNRREEYAPIVLAMREAQTKKGRPLSRDEQLQLIDSMLRGYRISGLTLGKPGFAKERTLIRDDISLIRFYHGFEESTSRYIESMTENIEERKFFGKTTKELVDLRANISRTQTSIAKLEKGLTKIKNPEAALATARAKLATLQAELIAKDDGLLENSIANHVLDLVDTGAINYDQQRELTQIFEALFKDTTSNKWVHTLRSLEYAGSLAQIPALITQYSEVALSLLYAPGTTLPNFVRAHLGKSKIKLRDIGVAHIGQEWVDADLDKTITWLLKPFESVDKVGKETFINSVIDKYRRMAKNNPDKLKQELAKYYPEEAFDSIINSLKSGAIDNNVKGFALNELADVQPISKFEVPELYARAGNFRVFYMYKTFMLKRLDILRNQAYNEIKAGIKSGSARQVLKGLAKLIWLAFMFTLADSSADTVKDLIRGKPLDTTENYVIDNLLQMILLSKWTARKVRQVGISAFFRDNLTLPVSTLDAAVRDVYTLMDEESEKGSELARRIPWVGEMYYWYMGEGARKIDEGVYDAD